MPGKGPVNSMKTLKGTRACKNDLNDFGFDNEIEEHLGLSAICHISLDTDSSQRL